MATIVCPDGTCILPSGHDLTLHPHTDNLARLINLRFDLLENLVTDVAGLEAQALADLNNAITDLVNRLGTLPQALADAQAALATALATDATDVAARDAALAQVQQGLDQATAVAADIETAAGTIAGIAPSSAAPSPAPTPEPSPAPSEPPVTTVDESGNPV